MSTTPNDPSSGGYGDTGGYGGAGGTGGYGGAPSYGSAPAQGSGSNPMAIISLVAGILSILAVCAAVIPFVGPVAGLIFAIVAIALAIAARRRAATGPAGQGGLAKAGLITGIIGLVLNVITLGLTIAGFAAFGGAIENCSTVPAEEQQACLEQQINNG